MPGVSDSEGNGRGCGPFEIRLDSFGERQVGEQNLHRFESREFHAHGTVFLVDRDECKPRGTRGEPERAQKPSAADRCFLKENRGGEKTLSPNRFENPRKDEGRDFLGRFVAIFEDHGKTVDAALKRHDVAVERLALRGEGP